MKFRIYEESPGRFIGQWNRLPGVTDWEDITDYYSAQEPIESLIEKWIDLIKRGRTHKEWEI